MLPISYFKFFLTHSQLNPGCEYDQETRTLQVHSVFFSWLFPLYGGLNNCSTLIKFKEYFLYIRISAKVNGCRIYTVCTFLFQLLHEDPLMSQIFAEFYFDPYFCGFRDIQLLVRGWSPYLYTVHIWSLLHFCFTLKWLPVMNLRYS